MKYKKLVAAVAAFAAAVTLSGCAAAQENEEIHEEFEVTEEDNVQSPSENTPPVQNPSELPEVSEPDKPADAQPPAVKRISYICVTGTGVAIRSGAGTSFSQLGTAQKNTLYTYLGKENGWYKTRYRNKTAYISSKFCVFVDMDENKNEKVEAVIAEGANHLGTPYVYGATRYHDGNGNKLKGFSTNAFDCSSLMQYMFYMGANTLLQVNTRTQVYQGNTVNKSGLKRGDLMFFTNAQRYNKTGVERIGHVAMYLGGNYILHTASDYAKIEQISSTRWSYFIQGQRIF